MGDVQFYIKRKNKVRMTETAVKRYLAYFKGVNTQAYTPGHYMLSGSAH